MKPSIDAEWLVDQVVSPAAPWTQVDTVATTGSTNADLAAAARSGAASGAVLVSDHQSTGRGRFARTWTAPPGASLAISALLRPPRAVPARRWLWLPLLTGLAVADGVRESTGLRTELKWPNDVLIEGRKLAGILCERVDAGPAPAAILGMGINTTLAADELPVPTATSVSLAGSAAAASDVAASVVRALGRWYTAWLSGADLRDDYATRCSTLDRAVRVELSASESVTGQATGVDSDGCLLVFASGRERAFAAGDVVHLR